MLNTVVRHTRVTLALSDGSIVYQLTVDVTDAGELPHRNLFVFEILDTLDATRDAFTRVGNPYDLNNVYTTRAGAITNGQKYYLAASMVKRYADLTIATQAIDAIRSRIDNSVNAWHTYNTVFAGIEDYNHPTAEATYEQQLQDTYSEAKDARIAVETEIAAADLALTLAQDEAADAVDLSNKYKQALDFTTQSYKVYWNDYYAAVGQTGGVSGFAAGVVARFNSLILDFLAISGQAYVGSGVPAGAYTPDATTAKLNELLNHLQLLEGVISTFTPKQSNGQSLESSFGGYHISVGGYYTAQQGVISAANVAAAAAVTAKKEAEASLAAAQAVEDAALAAVLAVCPTFDPASV
jgi:hypothetical protein